MIGVIAFLAVDAVVLIAVLKRHRSQDDYGSFPIPGSKTVMIAEPGRLRVTYQESINAPQDSHGDIDFDVPGIAGMGSSVTGTPKWTRAVIGNARSPSRAPTP